MFEFLQKILAMLPREWRKHFTAFLHNKDILEYVQIARNGTESKIPYIEIHSRGYIELT